jgi:hypothetical protein
MARDLSRRDQHGVEADVAADIVRIERKPERRSVGDPALLSHLQRLCCGIDVLRAFTSTKIRTPRRLATMSTSPNGVLNRRATIR